MVFFDENTMLEMGIDESYLEVWRRRPHSQEPHLFSPATGQNRLGLINKAYLMRTGRYVAFASPRAIELPTSESLYDAIKTEKPTREKLLDWLDMEVSFGQMLNNK